MPLKSAERLPGKRVNVQGRRGFQSIRVIDLYMGFEDHRFLNDPTYNDFILPEQAEAKARKLLESLTRLKEISKQYYPRSHR